MERIETDSADGPLRRQGRRTANQPDRFCCYQQKNFDAGWRFAWLDASRSQSVSIRGIRTTRFV